MNLIELANKYGVKDGIYIQFDLTHDGSLQAFTKDVAKLVITSALDKAYECNDSNGYHNAYDMQLIIDAVLKELI